MTPNIPITEIQARPQQFAFHTTWNTYKSILQSFQPNFHLQFNVPNQPGTKQPIRIIVLTSFFLFPLRNLIGSCDQSVRFYLYIYFAFFFFSFFQRCTCFRCTVNVGPCAKITKATLLTRENEWIDILFPNERS